MIHFDGVETFPGPPAELYPKLSDAGFLASCLPDATVTEAATDRAAWTVKPTVSFISGTLDTVAEVVERSQGTRAKYRLETKAVGGGLTVEAVLHLEPAGADTAVKWGGDIVAYSGLMKLAPKGLIQSSAQKVIAEVWAAVKKKLAEETVTPKPN